DRDKFHLPGCKICDAGDRGEAVWKVTHQRWDCFVAEPLLGRRKAPTRGLLAMTARKPSLRAQRSNLIGPDQFISNWNIRAAFSLVILRRSASGTPSNMRCRN